MYNLNKILSIFHICSYAICASHSVSQVVIRRTAVPELHGAHKYTFFEKWQMIYRFYYVAVARRRMEIVLRAPEREREFRSGSTAFRLNGLGSR